MVWLNGLGCGFFRLDLQKCDVSFHNINLNKLTNMKIANFIKPTNSIVEANLVKIKNSWFFAREVNLGGYCNFENLCWKLHNTDQIRYTDPMKGCTYPHWAEDRWCDDENNNAACNNFVCGCVWTCERARICGPAHVHVRIRTHACTHAFMHACTRSHTHACVWMRVCMYACVLACAYACLRGTHI